MRHAAVIAVTVLLLAGCASGYRLAEPPAVTGQPATIVVVRPYNFVGSGGNITLRLDGVELYELGSSEHVAISVAPGEHVISTKTWDPSAPIPIRIYPTETVMAEAGRTYYFRIQPGRLSRAADAEGRELVADTTPVSQLPQEQPVVGTDRPMGAR